MGFFKNFRRRMSIFKAFEFGRTFYGLDLEPLSIGIIPLIIKEVEKQDDPMPEAIFFMLVPAYLGILDGLKRSELYDGLLQMKVYGRISDEIYNNFMLEYELANLSSPREWVEDAVIGAQNRFD